MKRQESIGARVSQRKRSLRPSLAPFREARPNKSRRRLVQENEYTNDDIEAIKKQFGHLQHHGTGNPLNQRAPSAVADLAISNLAAIISTGRLGQVPSERSNDSLPQLATERGNSNEGSFWACRLRLAGSYGWTGLLLDENASTREPLPISEVKWFLVERDSDLTLLESKLDDSHWQQVKERVITVRQLAQLARNNDR